MTFFGRIWLVTFKKKISHVTQFLKVVSLFLHIHKAVKCFKGGKQMISSLLNSSQNKNKSINAVSGCHAFFCVKSEYPHILKYDLFWCVITEKKDVSLVCKVGDWLDENFCIQKKKILGQKLWKFIFSNNTIADVKATNHMRFPDWIFKIYSPVLASCWEYWQRSKPFF